MQRRLAAILIADVAGYSRLSHVDEEGTRTRFQADLHELFEPSFAARGGRLVKTMGDGLLVEFPSVVDAVRCAVAIQRAKAERDTDVPADRRLVFRIGINLGDVIVEGDDIQGDGVNIAARLEALAEPGGIVISGTAYDQVEKRLDVGYAYLGEQTVKNIGKPVRVYRVLTNAEAAGRTIDAKRRLTRVGGRVALAVTALTLASTLAVWLRPWQQPPGTAVTGPGGASLAVLPFDNLSGDPAQGYLADGITDDMTTDLARVPGLFVISRHAAERYRNQVAAPDRVGADLHVRYIVEGSVRRLGDELRINAQLIDAESGGHLWAERFDGAWGDVFALQDRIVTRIAESLALRLRPQDLSAPGGTDLPAAYDAYLRGIEHYDRFWAGSPQQLAQAAADLQQAVALDPNYGQAYAALADIHLEAWGGWDAVLGVARDDMLPKVNAYLQLAMAHPSARAYRSRADLLLRQRAYDAAVADLERAIALDPSDPENHAAMAWTLLHAGRLADAQRHQAAAVRLDPRYEDYACHVVGLIQFVQDRFADAADVWARCVAEYPTDHATRILLVAALGHLGRIADAATHYERANEFYAAAGRPPFSILSAYSEFPLQLPADAERLWAGLRGAGVPGLPFGYAFDSPDRLTGAAVQELLFGRNADLHDLDSALDCTLSVAGDGSSAIACGAATDQGSAPRFDGEAMCQWWNRRGERCTVFFRAPDVTAEDGATILAVTADDRWQVSLVE